MSFIQDQFSKIMAYFDTEDVEAEAYEEEGQSSEQQVYAQNQAPESPAPQPQMRAETRPEKAVNMANPSSSSVSSLNQREQQFSQSRQQISASATTTIDIKFPKKYEEARDIVNLLVNDVSVLIDFQHMTDSQARRCIDYLDGARFVLQGNLKKISSTMWLLTPANVVVNIEEMNLRGESRDASYDYDMKRR